MDAKTLQLMLTAIIAVGLIVIAVDVGAWLRGHDATSRFHLRSPGVILAGVGFLCFLYLAVALLNPPPGWEPATPRDQGYRWFYFFPAALVGGIAILATIRPKHAAWALVALAAGLPVILGLVLVGTVVSGGQPGDGSDGLFTALLAVVSAPAAFTAFALFVENKPRSARSDQPGTEWHAG